MRQDFFEFEQTWSITLVVNHKPVITGQDTGIWRRIRLVPWEATIPEKEQRPQDEVVKELAGEASAVLNWLLDGLEDWQADPKWIAEEVRAATEQYKAEQDAIAGWLAERCKLGPTYSERIKDLYDDYKQYCGQEGDKPISKKRLSQMLDDRGCFSPQDKSRHKVMKYKIKLIYRTDERLGEEDLGSTY